MNKCVHNMLMTPWPRVGPQKPDRALVRALAQVYAGGRGELTAVAQYFYNSLLLGGAGLQDLSELFACVSRAEMLHLEKLGQLILQFGGDPRLLSYPNGRPVWWSSGAAGYTGDVQEMLRRAVESERQAVHTYRQLAGRMQGAPKALIERILQDEEHHLELFQRAQGERMQQKNMSSTV